MTTRRRTRRKVSQRQEGAATATAPGAMWPTGTLLAAGLISPLLRLLVAPLAAQPRLQLRTPPVASQHRGHGTRAELGHAQQPLYPTTPPPLKTVMPTPPLLHALLRESLPVQRRALWLQTQRRMLWS